jgi:hypothetical protein
MFRSVAILSLVGVAVLAKTAAGQAFTVDVANGQAEVGKDQHSYKPAAINSTYTIPSWGLTKDNSSLTISFNPQNRFRLLANSEAQVKAGDGDSKSAWHRVISLKIGSAEINHDTGAAPTVKLDCETPTAVCGAVGTVFQVNATQGVYKVSSGTISVSSSREDNLRLPRVGSGGSVVFNPGSENTYTQGDFSGTVVLDGSTFHASDANFTVAKILDSGSETAVHIGSGKLGDYGPGDYLMDGGSLKRVDSGSKAATIHPQYLAAAKREGVLSVERAAYRASNQGAPSGIDAQLASAASEATRLRKELFTRETVRETVKQTVNAVRDASRDAAQGARYRPGR